MSWLVKLEFITIFFKTKEIKLIYVIVILLYNEFTNSISQPKSINFDKALKDFSIITFKHREKGKDLGTIAIIGPTRMDYSKVISVMKYISKKLNENFDDD